MEERWNEERMESANAAPDATPFFRIDVSARVSHSASWEQLPDGSPDAPHSSSEGAPIRASSRKRPPYGSPIQGSLEPLHGSHFFFPSVGFPSQSSVCSVFSLQFSVFGFRFSTKHENAFGAMYAFCDARFSRCAFFRFPMTHFCPRHQT